MRFRRELETRGVSPNTLRAYGADLTELAAWATGRGNEPATLAYRDLRAYAAALSGRGLARSSVSRKLAAVRSFHDHLVRTGDAEQNPAELLPTPKAESKLPRVLGPDEVATLLERIPARTPLEMRDRAIFELAYSCGLRAEEIVNLDSTAPTSIPRCCAWRARGRRPASHPSASRRNEHCAATSNGAARRSSRAQARKPSSSRGAAAGCRPRTSAAA